VNADSTSEQKVSEQSVISVETFARFWEWYLPLLKTINNVKAPEFPSVKRESESAAAPAAVDRFLFFCEVWSVQVHALYKAGFIKGFIGKGKANQLLEGKELGTFIMRFSQTNPGNIVVSYVGEDRTVRDFMLQVTRDAIIIKEDSYPTIAEALKRNPKMKKLRCVSFRIRRQRASAETDG
jgi:hypothetical protein